MKYILVKASKCTDTYYDVCLYPKPILQFESKNPPPLKISYIFPEQLGICNPNFNILHTYYTFLSTLDYYLLLHYLKL